MTAAGSTPPPAGFIPDDSPKYRITDRAARRWYRRSADSHCLLMPSITITREKRCECALDDCDAEFGVSAAVGSYCSRKCRRRDRGRRLLRDIRQDHRFCWSCFRQRKEIERPPDNALRGRGRFTAEALIGFEYETEHVEHGPHGIECECGGIDHDMPDFGQRDQTPFHWYLALASRQLVADGRREDAVDTAVFADELWQTDDLELAVGRALSA